MATIKGWFTMNGMHIPIMEGQSRAEAASKYINSKHGKTVAKLSSKTNNKKKELKDMTRKELAEYIVDDQIKRGVIKEDSKDKVVDRYLKGAGAVKAQSWTDLYNGAKAIKEGKEKSIKKSNETKSKSNVSRSLSNKSSIIDYVKTQTGVDLSKIIEPKTAKSRTYLGVHLEDLTINQRNEVKTVLAKYGHKLRIGDNGGYGYAIYYEKDK